MSASYLSIDVFSNLKDGIVFNSDNCSVIVEEHHVKVGGVCFGNSHFCMFLLEGYKELFLNFNTLDFIFWCQNRTFYF